MTRLSASDRFYQIALTKKILVTKPLYFRKQYLYRITWRRILETLFIAALINGSQAFQSFETDHSLLSPTVGLSLSALFLRGRTALAGIFLGYIISYLTHPFAFSIVIYRGILFTLYILLIRETCLRWIGTTLPLPTLTVFLKFMAIGLLYSMLSPHWIADLNGILYLTPLCLLFDPFSPEQLFCKKARTAWLSTLVLLLIQGSLFFLPLSWHVGILWIVCGLMSIYAFYFSPLFVAITLLGLSVIYLGIPSPWLADNQLLYSIILCLQASLSLAISIHRHQFHLLDKQMSL